MDVFLDAFIDGFLIIQVMGNIGFAIYYFNKSPTWMLFVLAALMSGYTYWFRITRNYHKKNETIQWVWALVLSPVAILLTMWLVIREEYRWRAFARAQKRQEKRRKVMD